MSVTGPSGGKPVKVGQAIGDLTAGMHAAIGILAKLHERNDSGKRSGFEGKLDVGLFGAIVSVMNEYLTFFSMNGEVPGPQGVTHQSIVPYQLFETSDGEIVLAVPSDQRWSEFAELIGREELKEYPTNQERYENRAEVTAVIQEEMERKPTAYWSEKLT
jgi:crotonobetainyl-CoA:carnitine CoA-transferase CaiB-like acyl-CoA transferase